MPGDIGIVVVEAVCTYTDPDVCTCSSFKHSSDHVRNVFRRQKSISSSADWEEKDNTSDYVDELPSVPASYKRKGQRSSVSEEAYRAWVKKDNWTDEDSCSCTEPDVCTCSSMVTSANDEDACTCTDPDVCTCSRRLHEVMCTCTDPDVCICSSLPLWLTTPSFAEPTLEQEGRCTSTCACTGSDVCICCECTTDEAASVCSLSSFASKSSRRSSENAQGLSEMASLQRSRERCQVKDSRRSTQGFNESLFAKVQALALTVVGRTVHKLCV